MLIAGKEGLTIAHLAAKGGLFKVLDEVFMDEYGFDPDYYKPSYRLSLLHVIGKYQSVYKWTEEKAAKIEKLVSRCNNLTLRNNMGSTILRCMESVRAHDDNIEKMRDLITSQITLKTKRVFFLLNKLKE